jgi:hypothetical protein
MWFAAQQLRWQTSPVSGKRAGLLVGPAMIGGRTADDSLPRFESWTCHQKPQVKLDARIGPSGVGERCRTPPVQPARTQNPACRQQQGTR